MANPFRQFLEEDPEEQQRGLRESQDVQVGRNPIKDYITTIPTRETARGTVIPQLGEVYRQYPLPEDPIARRSVASRRGYVGKAVRESTRTEELLTRFGVEHPEIGETPWHSYITHPLMWALTQLQRGQFAVIGGLEGVLEGEPSTAVENFYRGLIFAEPHSTHDILERYDLLQDSPVLNFITTFAGDVVADPITWLTFGTSAVAKGTLLGTIGRATTKVDDILPHLSKFGKSVLKEATETVGEDVAVRALLDEVALGTKLGKKLLPHGARMAYWVPRIGGQRIGDIFSDLAGRQLMPGGVLQKIDDIEATQTILDKISEALIATKPVQWFGQAFVTHWDIKRKFPLLAQMLKAFDSRDHDAMRRILDRGRELIKEIPDEADRKLITELLEKPHLLSGRRLVKVKRTRDDVVKVDINTDYWEEGYKISETDANDLIDWFLEIRRSVGPNTAGRQAARNLGVDLSTVGSGVPLEQRLLLGEQGMRGAVFGGPEKFGPLEPIFEAIANATGSAKRFDIRFNDFVIKIPGEQIGAHMAIIAQGGADLPAVKAFWTELIIPDTMLDMFNEAYIVQKLGSEVAPATQMVWRTAGDFVDPQSFAGTVFGTRRIAEMLPPPLGHVPFDDLPAPTQWAFLEGGYQIHRKASGTQAWTREAWESWIKQNYGLIPAGEHPVPILVKKFIQGETWDSVIKEGQSLLNHITSLAPIKYTQEWYDLAQELDDTIYQLGKLMTGSHELVKKIARTGVSPEDWHGGNIMYNANLDKAVWVDNAAWTDFLHGKHSQPFYAGLPEKVGEHALARQAKKVDIPRGADNYGQRVQNLRNAQRKAFEKWYDMYFMGQSAGLRNGFPESWESMLARYVRAMKFEMGYSDNEVLTTMFKFMDQLKEKGVIKAWKLSGDVNQGSWKAPQNLFYGPLMEDEALQWIEGGLGHYLDNPKVFQIMYNKDPGLIPLTRQVDEIVTREWDEAVEVMVARHPKFQGMSVARQENILKGVKMAKAWKSELDNALVQRGMLSHERIQAFKKKYGLDQVPHLKDINDPFKFFQVLRRSLKGRRSIGSLKYEHEIKGAIDEINREFGTELFEADIALVLTRHALDVGLASRAHDFIKEVGLKFGKALNVGDDGKKFADSGWMALDHPALEGLQIPEEVAKVLTKYVKTFGGDKAGRKFWHWYDKILNIWKGYATFVNPGFHGRNAMSNMGLLYLKDGPLAFDPSLHIAAVNIMRGTKGTFRLFNGTTLTYDEVMDLARRHGVYGSGWFGTDIRAAKDIRTLLDHPKGRLKRLLNPVGQQNIPFQVGKYIGGWVENEARMVGFLADLKRTANPAAAAERTKKFLFDYNDITDFERDTMKRIIPFYTWMRKNIALQMEQIIKQPAKFGDVARMKAAIEAQAPAVDERWTPKYFPELYAVRTPMKTSKGSPLYLNPNMPFQDINRMFNIRDWLSSLAPWKVVMELALNKQFFSGKEIERYEGEMVEAEWLNMLPEHVLTKVGPMIGAHQVYEVETGRTYWGIPPKVKFAIEQAQPFFKNIGKYVPRPSSEVPYYRAERAPWDFLAATTGLKFIPYNVTEEMERRIFERRDRLRDVKRAAEKQGRIPSKLLPKSH